MKRKSDEVICLRFLVFICLFLGRFFPLIQAKENENGNITSGQWNVTTPQSRTDGLDDLQPSVTCSRDVIEVFIPKSSVIRQTGRSISPDYIIFSSDASEHCRGTLLDGDVYSLKIDLRSKFLCGSKKRKAGYQTEYRNEVVLLDSKAGEIRSLVNITCTYRNDQHIVIMGPEARKMTRKIGTKTADIEMNIYRDKSYSNDAKFDDGVPQISVGHFLYVSIDLTFPGSHGYDSYHVIANSCFASYYADQADQRMTHKFITDGCADNLDSTVSIQSNGNGFASRWKFQMFKWVNTTSQRIYLYCQVDVCDERTRGHCNKNETKENCFGRDYAKRERRDLGGNESPGNALEEGMLSIGPIYPKDSIFLLDKPKNIAPNSGVPDGGNYEEESKQIVPIAVGVVLAVCAVMLSVSGYLMWKRYVARKNERREQSKKKIEQGFAFVMKSSEDTDIFGLCEKEKKTLPGTIRSKMGSVSRSVSRGSRREVKDDENSSTQSVRHSKRRRSRRKINRAESERGRSRCGERENSTKGSKEGSDRKRTRSNSTERSKRDRESHERQNGRSRHRSQEVARSRESRRTRSASHNRTVDHAYRRRHSSSYNKDQ